jgi:hypothetical protein
MSERGQRRWFNSKSELGRLKKIKAIRRMRRHQRASTQHDYGNVEPQFLIIGKHLFSSQDNNNRINGKKVIL